MKRLLVVLLAVVAFGVAGLAQTPEPTDPPPRLKKKSKPALPETKPEKKEPADEKLDPRDEPSAAVAPAEGDEAEVLRRLAKNTRAAEERLTNRELGDGVRQIQADILKDLDSLIAGQSQPQQPQGGGGQQNQQEKDPQGGGQDRQPMQGGNGGQDKKPMGGEGQGNQPMGGEGQGNQPMQGGGETRPGLPGENQGGQQTTRREIRKQRERERTQTARGSQQGPGQGQQRPGPTGQGSNPTDSNPMSRQDNKTVGLPPREVDPRFDIWGHLDETERLKMNRYMDEKFMDKYDELTRQYYRTIAEKSRRKGN